MPTFASIDVSDANTADSSANVSHMIFAPITVRSYCFYDTAFLFSAQVRGKGVDHRQQSTPFPSKFFSAYCSLAAAAWWALALEGHLPGGGDGPPSFVSLHEPHPGHVADGDHVLDLLDTLLVELGDVHQTVLPGAISTKAPNCIRRTTRP